MNIISINWLSLDAQEALLQVGNDELSCAVFCHPCSLKVGDRLESPLLALTVENIVKVEESAKAQVIQYGNSFAHHITAKVLDREQPLVAVNSIHIELSDELPGDIQNGDVVEFSCHRLDCMD